MFRDEKENDGGRFAGNAPGQAGIPAEAVSAREPLLGIDLGSRKIRAIAGWVSNDGKVEIINVQEADSNGVRKGFITDPEAAALDIRATLEELSLFAGTGLKKAYVSLPGSHIRRFTYGGSFLRKNPKKNITWDETAGYIRQTLEKIELRPGDKLIHYYPQEFMIDGNGGIKDPSGMKGKEIDTELQVVTGQVTNIQDVINCLDKAGLEVIGFIPSFMASAESVLSDEEKKNGVAVLEIGASATQLAIYTEGFLRYSSVVPFGSGIISDDIKDGLLINRKEAELLKMKTGSALAEGVRENDFSTIRMKDEPREVSVKNLARIIQARMEEILDMAVLEIKNSGYENELNKGIVLTGGGAQLKNLSLLVGSHTGISARVGYPVERLAGGIDMEYRNPGYATAIGLLLKGNQIKRLKFNVQSQVW